MRLFTALSLIVALALSGSASGATPTKTVKIDYAFTAKFKHDFNKKNPKVPFTSIACWKTLTSGINECIAVETGGKAPSCGSLLVDSNWPKGFVNQALIKGSIHQYTCKSIRAGITQYLRQGKFIA